jgi:hypothetical protein
MVALSILWLWYARDYPRGLTRPTRTKREGGAPSLGGLFTNRNLMLLTLAYGTLGYFQYMILYRIHHYCGEFLP